MGLSILCVGKLRERFYADAVAEYGKRMAALSQWAVVEVADAPDPRHLSEPAIEQTLRAEGERLLARLPQSAYAVALCVDAKQPTSEELAERIRTLQCAGTGEIVFIIGGSLGLHQSVLARANERIGLSRMTLPHQLARVVLAEQLYRALKINAGHRYHK